MIYRSMMCAGLALMLGACAGEPDRVLTTASLRAHAKSAPNAASRAAAEGGAKGEADAGRHAGAKTPADAKRDWCEARQRKLARGEVTNETVGQLQQLDDYCRAG